MVKEKKMSAKEWCKEYAPDMGFKFIDKGVKGNHYWLVDRKGKATAYDNLGEVRNVILKALMKYVDERTVVVDMTKKK
jgi:hypothetical protein